MEAPAASTMQGTVLKVTRVAPSVTVAGLGTLTADQAYYPYYATSDKVWGPLDRFAGPNNPYNPVGADYDVKSWIWFKVNVQTTGWYLINVVATKTGAELRTLGTTGYSVVQTFPRPAVTGYTSYPVLLNLAAGWHNFSWTNLNYFPYVSEVSVTKI